MEKKARDLPSRQSWENQFWGGISETGLGRWSGVSGCYRLKEGIEDVALRGQNTCSK